MTIFRQIREQAGFNHQEPAAVALGISKRQLQRYEAGEKIPEDMLLKMAVVYKAPELILAQIEKSPIHDQLGEVPLNNVNDETTATLVKYAEELEEGTRIALQMIKVVLNIRHADESIKNSLVPMMEQSIYDIKTALARAEVSVLRVVGVETGIEARRRHKDKCLQRGYLTKERQPGLMATGYV